MLSKIFSRLSVVGIVLILLISCDYKSDSFGDFEKIYVVADSLLYNSAETELEQVFDGFIYTPHQEKSFYLEHIPLKSLNAYNKRRNLIFLVLLDGQDETSQYIDGLLSPEVKAAVKQGRVFYVFQEDLFTRNQMAIIMIGTDTQSLKNNLLQFKDDIFDQMNEYHFARLDTLNFDKGEQVALSEYFWDNLGWKIRVQHDYNLVKETESGDFVWLRRFKPDRNLFVYRFAGDSAVLNKQAVIQIRDSLAQVYFEGDYVEAEDTNFKHAPFKGNSAIIMTGVWQNDTHYIGGPFKSYTLYHEPSGKVYMVDFMVTAPGKRKKPFLDQLETMARTFTIK